MRYRFLNSFILFLLAWTVFHPISLSAQNADLPKALDLKEKSTMRRPEAIISVNSSLLVANRESGTISTLKLKDGKFGTVNESKAGDELTDLRKVGDLIVATDFRANQIIGLQLSNDETKLEVLWRKETCVSPVKLIPNTLNSANDTEASAKEGNNNSLMTATLGLWARQIEIQEFNTTNLASNTAPKSLRTIALDFNPGHACWIDDQTLLVAAAFGDQLATVNVEDGSIKNRRWFLGHRTGGISMADDGSSVLISQQRLSSVARSTRNDVHWGIMINNLLRRIPTDEFERADAPLKSLARAEKETVGQAGNGKADLGDSVQLSNGTTAVIVEGTNEIAMLEPGKSNATFVPVGCRPKGICQVGPSDGSTQELLCVTNSLDNSISIIDLETQEVVQTISLGPAPKLSKARRGERLFFDASLSHDNWMSCHSCHVDGHSNGLLNDNLSDGGFDSPKRVISLLGHDDTLPLAWSGVNSDYQTQIEKTLRVTMQSDREFSDSEIDELSTFVRSLEAPISLTEARKEMSDKAVHQQIVKGQKIFGKLGCRECHSGATFTSDKIVRIGVTDGRKSLPLNPPSLVGVSQRNKLFHDNRVGSLEGVFDQPGHQKPLELPPKQMSALLAFLRSL